METKAPTYSTAKRLYLIACVTAYIITTDISYAWQLGKRYQLRLSINPIYLSTSILGGYSKRESLERTS